MSTSDGCPHAVVIRYRNKEITCEPNTRGIFEHWLHTSPWEHFIRFYSSPLSREVHMDSDYLDLRSSTISQVEFLRSMMLTLCMTCVQQLRLLNKNTKALSVHHSPNTHFPNFSVCSCSSSCGGQSSSIRRGRDIPFWERSWKTDKFDATKL